MFVGWCAFWQLCHHQSLSPRLYNREHHASYITLFLKFSRESAFIYGRCFVVGTQNPCIESLKRGFNQQLIERYYICFVCRLYSNERQLFNFIYWFVSLFPSKSSRNWVQAPVIQKGVFERNSLSCCQPCFEMPRFHKILKKVIIIQNLPSLVLFHPTIIFIKCSPLREEHGIFFRRSYNIRCHLHVKT